MAHSSQKRPGSSHNSRSPRPSGSNPIARSLRLLRPAGPVEKAVRPVENDVGFPASVDLSQDETVATLLPTPKKGRKSAKDPTPPSSSSSPGEPAPTEEPKQIPTDEMLRSACGARQERGLANGEANVGTWIRELIAKYVGEPGKKAADIPQDQRPAFLRELLA